MDSLEFIAPVKNSCNQIHRRADKETCTDGIFTESMTVNAVAPMLDSVKYVRFDWTS